MGGGQAGQGLRNIFITVARQNATQVATGSGGGGDSSKPGGTSAAKNSKEADDKQSTSLAKMVKSAIGVQFTVAALLKQSQIFTGFLGAVFQVLGGLVDHILAPLAPALFKLVEVAASWLPTIGRWSEQLVGLFGMVMDYFAGIASDLSDRKVTGDELASKGFTIVSMSGLTALLSNKIAGYFGKTTWDDVMKSIFGTGADGEGGTVAYAVEEAVTNSKAKVINSIKNLFKAVMSTGIGKFLKVLGKISGKVLKVAAIFGIIIELKDIKEAWDEGNYGEAVTKSMIFLLLTVVPLVLAAFVGFIPGLIIGVVSGVIYLLWEMFVPEDYKAEFYANMEVFLDKMFKDGIFKGILNIIDNVLNPFKLFANIGRLFLTNDVKRTINDKIRNLADSIINGLIRLVNTIIGEFAGAVPYAGDALRDRFKIPEIDLDSWDLFQIRPDERSWQNSDRYMGYGMGI